MAQLNKMKKIFTILALTIALLSYSQGQSNKIDSINLLLKQASGKQRVDLMIMLSQAYNDLESTESNTLLDDAIKYSIDMDYQKGLGKAYQIKGRIAYLDNKLLTGISYYEKSARILSNCSCDRETAESFNGLAIGLLRMRKNIEARDTILFLINNYSDSILPQSLAKNYSLLATAYRAEGDYESVISAMDSAIKIEKANNFLEGLSNSYNFLGVMNSDIGEYKKSLYYYSLSEKTAGLTKDTLGLSYAYYNEAILFLDWGMYDKSLELLMKSKELLILLDEESELTELYSTISVVYSEIGDMAKAKAYNYKSIELANKYNKMASKAIVYHNMGEILFEENKYDSALIYLNRSLRYELEENNSIGIAESKSMIATVYVVLGNFNRAFTYFNEAEKVFIKYSDKQSLANIYIEYAKAHQKLQNDSLSVYYYNKGIQLASTINDRKLMLESYMYASKNLERLGEFEQALKYYKNYSALNDSLFNEKSKQYIDYMTLVLENQERDKELSQLENQQKVLKLETKNRSLYFLTAIIILIIVVVFFSWRYNLKKKSEMNLTKQYHTLLETEQKVKALLDASFDSTLLVDTQGKILTANNNNLNGFFQDAELMINKDISSFFTKTNSKVLHRFLELVLASLEPKETHIKEKNQTLLDIKISPVIDHNQQVTSLAFYIKDITQIERDKEEKKIMQNQLIQSQKMETVGTLAGGIAHDFNNYLATISGYISMSLEDVDPDTHVYKYLTNSKKAVVLAQDTVKKLLAFSRSNEIYFDKISSKNLIKDSMDMIKGAKPKNIVLKYPKDSKDYELLADKNQLTQVIINICTNAFHALGENKGTVELTVNETVGHPEFKQRRMLRICIKDDGTGMDDETKKRIFEPFFTTKDVGKGTGLGLSAASGIMKQHKGKIEVQTEFGVGTSFSLFLPIIS